MSQTCTACPTGTYQPLAGQAACLDCPLNATCSGTGLTAPTCNTGYTWNAATSTCDVITCNPGSAVDPTTGQCSPCAAGSYSP